MSERSRPRPRPRARIDARCVHTHLRDQAADLQEGGLILVAHTFEEGLHLGVLRLGKLRHHAEDGVGVLFCGIGMAGLRYETPRSTPGRDARDAAPGRTLNICTDLVISMRLSTPLAKPAVVWSRVYERAIRYGRHT